jgi:hypothetical protein
MESVSYISALAGLVGAAIGGLTSALTSWFTQRTLLRERGLVVAIKERERLFVEFINEASRLYGDALGHERDDITDIVGLYALLAHIRLVSSERVVVAAEHTIDAVIEAYQQPNRTLHEIREYVTAGGLDPMSELGCACRAELVGMRTFRNAPSVGRTPPNQSTAASIDLLT